jgi:hypothetical protein
MWQRPLARISAAIVLCLCGTTVAANGAPAIYRCEIGGVMTFSDRPCAPDAVRHEIGNERVSIYKPPASAKTASSASAKRKPRKPREPAGPDIEKQKQTCERLAQRLRDIRAKYRAGYSASEGERLKDREAKLKSQLRMARCG